MGDWEDKTWGEVRHFQGEQLSLFNHTDPAFCAPGEGEGFGPLGDRVYEALRSIAQRHPDQTVAAFSHGTAIRQFLGKVKGTAPEQWKELPP